MNHGSELQKNPICFEDMNNMQNAFHFVEYFHEVECTGSQLHPPPSVDFPQNMFSKGGEALLFCDLILS